MCIIMLGGRREAIKSHRIACQRARELTEIPGAAHHVLGTDTSAGSRSLTGESDALRLDLSATFRRDKGFFFLCWTSEARIDRQTSGRRIHQNGSAWTLPPDSRRWGQWDQNPERPSGEVLVIHGLGGPRHCAAQRGGPRGRRGVQVSAAHRHLT